MQPGVRFLPVAVGSVGKRDIFVWSRLRGIAEQEQAENSGILLNNKENARVILPSSR
jgi:hypothetical protein